METDGSLSGRVELVEQDVKIGALDGHFANYLMLRGLELLSKHAALESKGLELHVTHGDLEHLAAIQFGDLFVLVDLVKSREVLLVALWHDAVFVTMATIRPIRFSQFYFKVLDIHANIFTFAVRKARGCEEIEELDAQILDMNAAEILEEEIEDPEEILHVDVLFRSLTTIGWQEIGKAPRLLVQWMRVGHVNTAEAYHEPVLDLPVEIAAGEPETVDKDLHERLLTFRRSGGRLAGPMFDNVNIGELVKAFEFERDLAFVSETDEKEDELD